MMPGNSDAAKVRFCANSEIVLSSLCVWQKSMKSKSSLGRIGVKHQERIFFNFSLVGYEWKLTKD